MPAALSPPAPTATASPLPPTAPATGLPTEGAVAWVEVVQPAFRIAFPAAPVEEATTEQTLIGPISNYTVTLATAAGGQLSLIATTYPARLFERDDPGGLATFADARTAALGGLPLPKSIETPIQLGPFVGRRLRSPDGSIEARLFVGGATIYRIVAAGVASDESARFLASFTLVALPAPPVAPWQPVTLPTLGATLLLPAPPQEEVAPDGTLRYLVAQPERGVRWMVGGRPRTPGSDPRALLDAWRDGLVAALGGDLLAEGPLPGGVNEGRDLTIALPGDGYARAWLWLGADRLFDLVMTSETPISPPSAPAPLVPTAAELGWFFLSFDPGVPAR